jgi:hypothetical protein
VLKTCGAVAMRSTIFAMHRCAIGLLILLAACTVTQADEALSICQPLCRCVDVPLPSEQRTCSDACVTQLENAPLRDTCVTCVLEHTNRCPALINDCIPLCFEITPTQFHGARDELGIEEQ